MADAGVASRRDCEKLIEEGTVEVNGHLVAKLPAWVDPAEDRIVVNGRPLPPREKPTYVVLNKPVRTLTASRDEPGADRRTVLDLIDHPRKASLFPVGRLDYDTVGLLLLTNDGELANRLTHPRYGVPKTYRAIVRGELTEDDTKRLERGMFLSDRRHGSTVGGVRTLPAEIRVVHAESGRSTIDLVIREGRNRQVRRMLAAVELSVKKLERTAMGPLRLKGVPRGSWRPLTSSEVTSLKKACGMKSTRKSGKNSAGGAGRTPSGRPTA